MGDRYTLNVKCGCGYEDDEVWYAPTCGALTWTCPKCGTIIDLEEYSGIDAEGCASTDTGVKAVKELKDKLFRDKIINAFNNTKGVSKKQHAKRIKKARIKTIK